MPRFELRAVQSKLLQHQIALAMIPSIRKQDSAHVKKDHVEGEHRRLSSAHRWLAENTN
jgi:hypothetical protein